jgi:tyrosinase
MLVHSMTRRGALIGVGAMAASAAAIQIQPNRLRAQQPGKRKSIDSLTQNELNAYERAIQTIKDRSSANPDDPAGYLYWANLHDNFDDTIHSGCSHSSERFFPWHRRFLSDFEKILQQSVPGVTDNLMIPYWDWTQPPSGRNFPAAFERSASPLFDSRLTITPPPWDASDIHKLVKEPDWSLFGGRPDPSNTRGQSPGNVETGPHNHLHTNISADMQDPTTASLDPIFWSFHAFIDVVWARWQRLHITNQTPQPFRDGDALIWFRERSFPIKTTARISDFNYEYDYDYVAADGPVRPPTMTAAAAPASVSSPPQRTVSLERTAEGGRYLSFRPAQPIVSYSNAVLRIADVPVFHDRSYRLNVYLHPANIDISAINEQARRPLLVQTATLWRSHHDGKVELLMRLAPEQAKQLSDGAVLTISSELAAAGQDVLTASPLLALPTTSSLAGRVEVQER